MVQSIGTPALWLGFHAFVFVALFIDLFLLHKEASQVSKREAAVWSTIWISSALAFGAGLWWFFGKDIGLQFFAGYLIEESLSVDNLFVFMLVFSFFKVPEEFQHRVLFWGIFGAIVLRGLMIWMGVALLARFEILIVILALVLLYSSIKLLFTSEEEEEDLSNNTIVKIAQKLIKVSPDYDGTKFRTVVEGVKVFTPLALVLIVVELSDVVFAIDSIPAVFGVATDPFVIYSSNICAILGLRALYFLLAGTLAGMRFLQPCLALVLGFVGIKMILGYFGVHIETYVALGVVFGLLITGIFLSVLFPTISDSNETDSSSEDI